jgi:uncharacterized protein
MELKNLIRNRLETFKMICKNHKVKVMYAFGSSISEKFNETTSDIDLIVELDEEDPIQKGEYLINLWNSLESFFQKKVDLITESSIKNPYLKKSIEANKLLIYDGSSQEILI